MAVVISENWDGVTAPAMPAGWSSSLGGFVTFNNTGVAVSSPNSLQSSQALDIAYKNVFDTNSGDVICEFSGSPGASLNSGWLARVQGSNPVWASRTCYMIQWFGSGNQVILNAVNNGSQTTLATITDVTLGTTKHKFRLILNGTTVKMYAQRLDTLNYLKPGGGYQAGLIACVDTTDSTVPHSAGQYCPWWAGGNGGLDDVFVVDYWVGSSVTVTPGTATINGSATQQYSATVNGTGNPLQTVTWSVVGPGSIDANGLYTAPAAIGSPQYAQIVATSALDANFAQVTGTAAVTINAAAATGGTVVFTATDPTMHVFPVGPYSKYVTDLQTLYQGGIEFTFTGSKAEVQAKSNGSNANTIQWTVDNGTTWNNATAGANVYSWVTLYNSSVATKTIKIRQNYQPSTGDTVINGFATVRITNGSGNAVISSVSQGPQYTHATLFAAGKLAREGAGGGAAAFALAGLDGYTLPQYSLDSSLLNLVQVGDRISIGAGVTTIRVWTRGSGNTLALAALDSKTWLQNVVTQGSAEYAFADFTGLDGIAREYSINVTSGAANSQTFYSYEFIGGDVGSALSVANRKVVAIIGDSIVNNVLHMPISDQWSYKLGLKLGYQVYNAGFAGAGIAGGTGKWDTTARINSIINNTPAPDLVIVGPCDTNDLQSLNDGTPYPGVTTGAISSSTTDMIHRIAAGLPTVPMLVVGNLLREDRVHHVNPIYTYDEWDVSALISACVTGEANPNITFADPMPGANSGNFNSVSITQYPADYQAPGDGIHPGPAGGTTIANWIYGILVPSTGGVKRVNTGGGMQQLTGGIIN